MALRVYRWAGVSPRPNGADPRHPHRSAGTISAFQRVGNTTPQSLRDTATPLQALYGWPASAFAVRPLPSKPTSLVPFPTDSTL